MRILLIFTILILLFTSCKKERTIHITAKNSVTGQPYAGLNYSVIQEKTGMNGEEFKTVVTGTLDSNGEAFITKKLSKRFSYSVRVEEPPNTCYNKQITFYFANQETTFECPFEFAPCAQLQRKVKNVSCFDSNDKIEILIDNQVHSLLTNPWILEGCADYQTVVSDVPIGQYTLQWTVTKNSITNIYYDTFILQENEFKYHEINY